MATVNLGRIKSVWRGTWATGTAYSRDDVVQEGVNSYICTQAHTAGATFAGDSANWDLMAQGAEIPTQSGNAGKVLKTDGSSLSWGDAGKTKQIFWEWDDTQASVPAVTASGTGLEIFSFNFTAATDNPHFILDLSLFFGMTNSSNDAHDVMVIAWIEEAGTLRYPFGFKKTTGFRSNSAFYSQSNAFFLEDTDASHYSSTADWGGFRASYPAVMGNQASQDSAPIRSSNISAGDNLTLKVKIGSSGSTWYNRTPNQTNSMSRSWFMLREVDGAL